MSGPRLRGFPPNTPGLMGRMPPPNTPGLMGRMPPPGMMGPRGQIIPRMGPPGHLGNMMGLANPMRQRMVPPNQMGPRMGVPNQMGPRIRLGPPEIMGPKMGPPALMMGPPNQMRPGPPNPMGPRMGPPNQIGPRMGPGPPEQMGLRMGLPNQMGPRMGPQNQMGPRIGLPNQMEPMMGLLTQMGPMMGPQNQMGNQMLPTNGLGPRGFPPNHIGNRMPPDVHLMRPLREIFQIPDHEDQFYIGISKIPLDISACELWGWMAGEMGKSQGVVLIRVPEDQDSSIAFAVFQTERDLMETMHKLKRKHEFVRPYSVSEANDAVASVESTSLVLVSTAGRTDKLLSTEMREMVGVGNIHKHKYLRRTKDDAKGRKTGSERNQKSEESVEETEDWDGITSVFPMLDRNDQFYIGLSNLKLGITASELKLYLRNTGAQTHGVVLARVPPSHDSLSSQAFAVFQNKEDSLKAMETMKTKQKHISEYSSADARAFLNGLGDNCIIFISADGGKDRMLVRTERAALRKGDIRSTGQLSITSKEESSENNQQALSQSTIMPNNSQILYETEVNSGGIHQPTYEENLERKPISERNKDSIVKSDGAVEPVDEKTEWEDQKFMFPMPGRKDQYYIKISYLREGITACKLLAWLRDSGCKAQGVLFAWIPTDPGSSPSQAFVLYHSEDDLQKSLKILKTIKSKEQGISQCSSTEANTFITNLGYNSILFMSTEKGKDVMLTHTERCKLEEEIRERPRGLGSIKMFQGEVAEVKSENKLELGHVSSLLPNSERNDQFYLGLSNLPSDLSACELWSWFGGVEGKSHGIVLGRVPPDHQFFSSLAFAVFKDVDDLEEAMQTLKTVHEYRARYSCSDVSRFLNSLDATCQIYVTTSSGKDKRVKTGDRAAIVKKDVTSKTELTVPKAPSETSYSKVLPPTPTTRLVPSKTSTELESKVFTPPPLRWLFPVPKGKEQFYLGLSNLPVGISASGLLSWMGGVKGPAQGVALARFPQNSNSPPSLAFAAFRSEDKLLKGNAALKNCTATIAQYSNSRVQTFFNSIDDSCILHVTSDSGNDQILTHSERLKVKENFILAEQGIALKKPPLQPNTSPFNESTQASGLEEEDEIPPQTWDKVISIFPSSGNQDQFFIELSNLRPNITASELWMWLCGIGGKTQGVVLAKVSPDHKSLSSRAFAVFQTRDDIEQVMQSMKTKQRNISECSGEQANAFLTGLDDSCLVFVSTESGKDRMLLNAERSALQMRPIKETISSPTQFHSVQQHSSLKRLQSASPPVTKRYDYSSDNDDRQAHDIKRRRKGESRWEQVEEPLIAPATVPSGVEYSYMSLLPTRVGPNLFYLAISHFPSNLTACELWSRLGGSSGTSLGVILGRVPSDHPWLSSLAFAVFQTEDALKEAMHKLKPTLRHVAQYSSTNAYDFLLGIGEGCPIYVSTGTGTDRTLTPQERSAFRHGNIKQSGIRSGGIGPMRSHSSTPPGQIHQAHIQGNKRTGNVKDSLLSIIATMGVNTTRSEPTMAIDMLRQEQGEERQMVSRDPWVGTEIKKQEPLMGPITQEQGMGSHMTTQDRQMDPWMTQQPKMAMNSGNTEQEDGSKTFLDSSFLLMFPSFSPTRKFYLGIFGVPRNVSASEIWAWVCGGAEKGEGIILGRVSVHNEELSCRAFVVFSNKEAMLEVLQNSVVLQEHKAECSPSDVNNYLERLDSSCQIFVTSVPGEDTMLTLADRASMGMGVKPVESALPAPRSPQPVPPPPPLLPPQRQHAVWTTWNSSAGPWV